MSRQLILVGGFLGAGKTTLLGRAAERLARAGKRVALVTNDQAANLVDTAVLEGTGAGHVREVAGGCFCCRFPDLITALEGLVQEYNPVATLCEPVGSCTDISATVIQPLKKLHAGAFRMAPFTVLVDPDRTIEALRRNDGIPFPGNVLYIFRKQVEEADLLVINKVDTTPAATVDECKALLTQNCPETPVLAMSALAGTGIDEWIEILDGSAASGGRIAEVDYDRYADGEAALGWLNAKATLAGRGPVDWRGFSRRLIERFHRRLRERSAEIAHVKFRLTAGEQSVTVNLTSTAGVASLRGTVDASLSAAELTFNARVALEPDTLRETFEGSLAEVAGNEVETTITHTDSFAPVRPEPTHRFDSVVVQRQ